MLKFIAGTLIVIALIIISALVYSVVFMFSPSHDIAIIGGADGPTSIFIASTPFDWVVPVLMIAISVVLIVISVCLLKKSKR